MEHTKNVTFGRVMVGEVDRIISARKAILLEIKNPVLETDDARTLCYGEKYQIFTHRNCYCGVLIGFKKSNFDYICDQIVLEMDDGEQCSIGVQYISRISEFAGEEEE